MSKIYQLVSRFMKEMCHEEIAGNICSGQCQDTARRMIYMGNKLREIWAKKILEI